MAKKARRSSWNIEPLAIPEPIPAPARVWPDDEMASIRRGYVPWIMDEKWFIFMEGNRLFAHRSWTGIGVHEATFAPTEGGHVIESAVVAGDGTKYRRSSSACAVLKKRMMQRCGNPRRNTNSPKS